LRVCRAFLRLGYLDAISYPLGFVTMQLSDLAPVFIYFFVAKLVNQTGQQVGNDYFTYVVLGLVVVRIISAATLDLGNEVTRFVTEGQFEMLLVEPVRWVLLPFGIMLWLSLRRLVGAALIIVVALALGARFVLPGLPIALLGLVLALSAASAVGLVGASMRVLTKRTDPILAFYNVAALVLSGAVFPQDLLPSAMRFLAYLLPHTYAIAILRRGLMQGGAALPGMDVQTAVAGLALFNVVAFGIGLAVFSRTLQYARRLGALGGY
jgi:ABC-2 type transport system permease protein